MKKLLTLLLFSIGLASMAVAQSGSGLPTVWDIISTSPQHTTLTAAIDAAGLDATLQTDGPFTVFAPTDEAFDALPPGTVDALLADPEGLLTDILLYHVVGATAMSGDLSDGQVISTLLAGETVTVTIDGGVFINNAQVTVPDLEAGNGVVHVIDAVLVPGADEPFTVWDIVQESPVHGTLEAAVLAAELDGALSNEEAQLTLFAPTDAAFNALPDGLLDDLLADPSGLLTDILLYHVVGSVALSTDLSDGMMITTLNGADVMVTFDGGNVFINDAQVIVADLEADNGVVHVIDAVLVPGEEPFTVWDIIMESEIHNTLEAAVLAAELEGALDNEEATLTVFAPTDAAFDALPDGLLDDLLADPSGLLTQILLYHVVGDIAFSGDLTDGQMITTLNGADVTVTIDGGVFINDAQVIVADLEADNGVVHVIDAVLVPGEEPFTVWDIIMESESHNTLEAAVLAAELEGALDNEEATLTVFAPTDAAFDALPDGLLDDLLADPSGLLTDILLYHVVGSVALSTDLSDGMMITTLNGADVMVTFDGGNVFINDAQVIVADLEADNGVVHVIDAVLDPVMEEAFTVWDIIMESESHNTLEAAVLAAELDGALDNEEATLTVFAPTDAAFDALPDGLLDDLLADPSGLLTQILLYHVVGDIAFSGDLTDGQMITTLNGADVTVTIDGGVFINDAQVIVADIEADNGVVHVIDAVLVPEMEEPFTVWDIIMESEIHNTLEAAVLAAELEGALDNEEATLTVFAPTDAAFDALPDGLLDDLLADPSGLLTQILLYHVVGDIAFSGDLTDGQMITTLNGADVTVTIDGGVFINDAQVIVADLEADNGVVHVIDAVLVPEMEEAFTVWDIIMESESHNTLEAAVLAAELDGALDNEEATLTVFAPTDAAFDALPDGLLDDLLADPSGLLTDILLYHVVGSVALSTDLSDGMMITTLNGADVMVTFDGGNVFINDAQVIVADLEADNGVVHVIDAVLVPEEGPCLDFLGGPYNNFNTLFGGAPVADEDGVCPVNQIDGFEAWASEQYIIEGFQEGVEYTFSICEGPGAGSWDAELSVTDLDGNLIAFEEGCSITWTSPADGDYLIGINEVGACGDESDNTGTDNGYPTLTCTGTSVLTVWDIVQASPVHTTLETAVLAAGLESALSDESASLTLFAPTDAAFAALPDGVLNDLLADPTGLLTDVLLYHVVGSTALSTDLSNGLEITTLYGEDVVVTITGEGVMINDAMVIVADLVADNGVVHVIDAVLVPLTLDVDEMETARMEMFPNPASGYVNLNLVNVTSNTSYQIVNLAGAVVSHGPVQPGMNTIDVQDLSTGMYLINIMDENNASVTEKLMIK